MRFLQQFLGYKRICIQCHNNPDADTLASAYGLYCFFTENKIDTQIIYGGSETIKKFNIKCMIEQWNIPIFHVKELPETELLLIVDGQYGQGNVEKFSAPTIAVIDHHICVMEKSDLTLIKSSYQSCSTLVWELLVEENYSVQDNESLRVALLYGLFTDTSSFYDLYEEKDIKMRMEISGDFPLFEKLIKSNMTVAELMIASDAMQEHYFDPLKRFAIVSAIRCDQSILGIVGDFMIQVDAIMVNFAYTTVNNGYQISIRSCDSQIQANRLAAYICEGIGAGGGHSQKAGGRVSAESLLKIHKTDNFFEFVNEKLTNFIDGNR